MATIAMAATIMLAFAPVLRILELVTSLAGCGEVEGKVEGKDDETTVVEELLVLDANPLDAAGAPRLLAINASAVEVVGLGSSRGDQVTAG